VPSLEAILKTELENPDIFSPAPPWPNSSSSKTSRSGEIVSPPFLPQNTITDGKEGTLPYHYLELSEILLTHSPDSFPSSSPHHNLNTIRSLLRDIREVRQSKLRAGMKGLEGGGVVSLRGVGAMEICVERGFVVGAIGGLRVLGQSREGARREREAEEGGGGDYGTTVGAEEDEEMGF
jgi:GINS complex subunit 2